MSARRCEATRPAVIIDDIDSWDRLRLQVWVDGILARLRIDAVIDVVMRWVWGELLPFTEIDPRQPRRGWGFDEVRALHQAYVREHDFAGGVFARTNHDQSSKRRRAGPLWFPQHALWTLPEFAWQSNHYVPQQFPRF